MGSNSRFLNKAQQNLQELAEFIAFAREAKIGSFLEIGSKFGGVIWAISSVLPKGARIVSVDMPNGQWGRSDSEESLRCCFDQLKERGFDAHLFLGDSTNPNIVSAVEALSPFDCLFIDANHTEPYVRKDFASYGMLAKHCCFHDIGWNKPTPPKRMPIEVPKVWKELKDKLRDKADFREIRCEQRHNGIGIISWK